MKAFLLVACCAVVSTQEIHAIDGIDTAMLRSPAPGATAAAFSRLPVSQPYLPESERTMYRFWAPELGAVGETITTTNGAGTLAGDPSSAAPTVAASQYPLVIDGIDLKPDTANRCTNLAGTAYNCPSVLVWTQEVDPSTGALRECRVGDVWVAPGTAGATFTGVIGDNTAVNAGGYTYHPQLLGNRATATAPPLPADEGTTTASFYFRTVNLQKLSLNKASARSICAAVWHGVGAAGTYSDAKTLNTMMTLQIRPRCDRDATSASTETEKAAPDFGLFSTSCATQFTTGLDTALAYQADLANPRPQRTLWHDTANTAFKSLTKADGSAIDATTVAWASAGLTWTSLVEPSSQEPNTPEGLQRYYLRRGRTTCCGWRDALTVGTTTYNKRWGVCIQKHTESCCSGREDQRALSNNANTAGAGGLGKPYNTFTDKCCFGGNSGGASAELKSSTTTRENLVAPQQVAIRALEDNCPCNHNLERDYCGSRDKCCTKSKYPEDAASTAIVDGLCFNPQSEKCCDTGAVYNPTIFQCCAITGVQDFSTPCPCMDNTHCGGNQTCCLQSFPVPEDQVIATCNKYLSYGDSTLGSGQMATRAMANNLATNPYCVGQCIDTRYQICCNGQTCNQHYQRCCNDTCVNEFTETCTMGYHRRTFPAGADVTGMEYMVPYEKVTSIEALLPHRAVLVYLLPIAVLLAVVLGLGASLYFATKINALVPISGYERTIYWLAFFTIIFAWPMVFSPLYKYSIVIIWVSFFTILAALSGIKRLILVAIFVQAFLLIVLVNPFDGNELLMFPYWREDPTADRAYSASTLSQRVPAGGSFGSRLDGMLPAISALWTHDSLGNQWCTLSYLGFFQRDTSTEDVRSVNPQYKTFGYCSREWIAALLILTCFDLVLIVLMFIATVVAHPKNILVKKIVRVHNYYDVDEQ